MCFVIIIDFNKNGFNLQALIQSVLEVTLSDIIILSSKCYLAYKQATSDEA